MLHRIGTALVVLLALACLSPQAQAGKVGPEFQVNTYTAGGQHSPSVAALGGGGFVVTWTSQPAGNAQGQDGSSSGVYGQRYSAAGARVGREFRVNTRTLGRQSDPSVATLSNGEFVVVWDNPAAIYGRRFSTAGTHIGDEFRVSFRPPSQMGLSVAALTNGGFVVTWTHYDGHPALDGIYGQLFTAAGLHVGGAFRVHSPRALIRFGSKVAGLGDGGFVVLWNPLGQEGTGYYGFGVYGRRYNSAGRPISGEFRVNTHAANNQWFPSVAALNNGGFVVVWESDGQDDTNSNGGIYGQRYNAAGARVGGEFRINTTTVNSQVYPSVAALTDGGFVATWESPGGIFGQRYNATGVPVGVEFQADTDATSFQSGAGVAGLSNGGFVVTWQSDGQDGSGSGVYGQRFSP